MAKLRVMLAEDDLTMINLLKTLLKMEGFEVIALDADADVVKALSENCPDVLLMDVHLSKQNGLEILDSIRRTAAACQARIIMTSGLNLKEDCLKRGANGFLLKPFMPDDLIDMLKGISSA
ncbi:MAG TPA: response regulator [Anaerolineales bacterium]|nr:response regulator [Anaerolineales bacterium]